MIGLSGLVDKLKEIAKSLGIDASQTRVENAKSLDDLLAKIPEDHKKRMLRGDAMFTDAQGRVMYVYIDRADRNPLARVLGFVGVKYTPKQEKHKFRCHVYKCGALTTKNNNGEANDYVGVQNVQDDGVVPLRGGQTVQISLCDKCFRKMIKEEFALDKLPEKDMYYTGKFKNKYFKQGCFDRNGTRQEQFMYGTYAESHIQEMDYGNRRQGQSVNFNLFDV